MELSLILALAPVTTILGQVYKWLAVKFGAEHTKTGVYVVVLVLSGVWTYLTQVNVITPEALQAFLVYVSASVGIYEVVVKQLKKVIPLEPEKKIEY